MARRNRSKDTRKHTNKILRVTNKFVFNTYYFYHCNMIKEMSNTEIIREIAGRIKQYRLNLRMTQAQLAKKTGISLPTIQKFESGASSNITFVNLLSILRYTGLIDNVWLLVPEQPESPYAIKTIKRVRDATRR